MGLNGFIQLMITTQVEINARHSMGYQTLSRRRLPGATSIFSSIFGDIYGKGAQ